MLRVLYPRRYLSLCNFKYTNNKKGRFLWKNIKNRKQNNRKCSTNICTSYSIRIPSALHHERLILLVYYRINLQAFLFSCYKVIFLKTHRVSLDASGCSRKPCVPSRVLYRSINIFYSAAFSDVSFIYFFA